MDGEVIKSFLVGLGFDVDDSSLAKFNKSIVSATIKVTALYTSIQVMAAGIFKGIAGISQGFEEMGYSLRLVAPAINKMLILRQAMLNAYRVAGVDLVKVVKQSILFNMSLAKTKFALEAVYKSVGAKFLPLLTKQMDIFRAKIFANMPKIQASLEKFVNFIFKAFQATVELGTRLWSILGRVWDFFAKLDEVTDGWSTKILGAIAVWKLLNLAFLATPLGLILTGLVAILALYDDFKTWQEGGKSLFNWSYAIPIINGVATSLKFLKDVIGGIFMVVFDLVGALTKLLTLNFSGFKDGITNAFKDLGPILESTFGFIKTFLMSFDSIKNLTAAISGYVSSLGGGAAPASNLASIAQPQPLMASGGNSNQKVNQETNITVQGSADANSVGKAVASEQSKVNFDMTRNLKGAMR